MTRRADEGLLETAEGSETGHKYQMETRYMIDDRRRHDVRVVVALVPLCRDFIKAPDGRFVGE